MQTASSEVKGIWFDTAREFLLDKYGSDALDEMLASIAEAHRDALANPLASAWYPEETLHQSLRAMYVVAANGSFERFTRDIEDCTLYGINRFFRVLVRMSSTKFILRQLPALSHQMRRSDLLVTLDIGEEKALVRYARFPWFRERLYRLVSLAQLRTVLRLAGGKEPNVVITLEGPDAIEMTVRYG